MPTKLSIRRGDIVLVPFPFTDLTVKKVRPAIIVSPDPQGGDILIAFISSVVPLETVAKTDYILKSTHSDFAATGLKRASIFKMNKLLAIESSKVLRRLGRVSDKIQKELNSRLMIAIGLSH